MEYIYDQEVRKNALLEDETIFEMQTPGKKAFFFYRVRVPNIVFIVAATALLLSNILYSIVTNKPFTGFLFVLVEILVILAAVVNYIIHKKIFVKRAYYVTDRRVLLVGGLFHLKYTSLDYRFIGSVSLGRTPFSKMFGMTSFSIALITNLNKRLTVKFFSLAGYGLSYLENPDKAYRQILRVALQK